MPFWIYLIIGAACYVGYQIHLRKKAELELIDQKQKDLIAKQKDLDAALSKAQADVDNVKHKEAGDLSPDEVEKEWNKK